MLIGFRTVTYLSRFNVAFGRFLLARFGLEVTRTLFVVWDFIDSISKPIERLMSFEKGSYACLKRAGENEKRDCFRLLGAGWVGSLTLDSDEKGGSEFLL